MKVKKIRVLILVLLILFILAWSLSPKRQRINYLVDIARGKYSSVIFPNSDFHFNLYCGNIYLGQFVLNIKEGIFHEKEVYEANLALKPPQFLRRISGDRIGLNAFSIISQETLLPYYFEQNDFFRKKKGKKGRIVEYQHDQLMMLRKGRIEDIEDDTRDYASLVVWLMNQDYSQKIFFKSTLNINRTIYLVLGKIKDSASDRGGLSASSLVKLKIKFIELTKDYQKKNALSVDAYLFKMGDYYVPLLFRFKKGLFTFTVNLNKNDG